MLSYTDGKPIAREGNQLIYLKTDDDESKNSDYDSSYDSEYDSDDNLTEIESDEKIEPLLNMDERSVAYIAGPSGSGKTTLLNCISTIDSITSGEVYLDNKNMRNLKSMRKKTFF